MIRSQWNKKRVKAKNPQYKIKIYRIVLIKVTHKGDKRVQRQNWYNRKQLKITKEGCIL